MLYDGRKVFALGVVELSPPSSGISGKKPGSGGLYPSWW